MPRDLKRPGVSLTSRVGLGPGGLGPAVFADWYREEALARWRDLDFKTIARIAAEIEKVERKGKQILVIGNGGAAALASHMATDFSKTASRPERAPLRCISLTDNVALMTAIANDQSYDDVFTMQLRSVLDPGDLLIIMSGSGNSPNVVKAAKYAKKKGAVVTAIVGFSGGKLKAAADITLHIRSEQYGVIEDFFLGINHILAFYLKQRK